MLVTEFPTEFPEVFLIGKTKVKAVDSCLEEDETLLVLCQSFERKFHRHHKHKSLWFDMTTLPDNVCEFYYNQYNELK